MTDIKKYTKEEIDDILLNHKDWECSYCHRIATKDNDHLNGPYLSTSHRDIMICNSCK